MLDDRRGSRFELAQIATLFWACLVVCHAFAAEKPAPAAPRKERLKPISFNRDIRPILSDRCFGCHGPDPASREADLRLDQAEGDSGAHSWAIEPGSPADSELWARITSNDDSDRMPPPDSHKERLSQSELALVRRWINDGAHYEKFWAFEPAVWAKPPTVEDSAWQQPIDAFVLDRILSDQARPAANATPRMLIRRVTFDVTGLPPTREEISRFLVEVEQQSFDKAYEALVDRLIASPRYGEHMARYWLDLVRFADTNGIHKDFYRNHVAYRDWVIRAFNSNLGYDDFLRYQLAGDLYDTPTRDQLVASGFNRLHLIIDRGTALPEESFHRNVVDRVTAVSTAFMGLTVQCAQCHDHKYDPITQEDFYSLYAFFNNIDTNPETTYLPHRGLQQPFVSLASSEQQATLSDLDKAIAAVDRRIGEIEALVGGDEATLPAELQSLKAQRKRLRSRRARLDDSIPYAMVAKERSEVRKTCLLERGEYEPPGK